jgi:predicted XRE-type DNA-binding protein
MDGPDGEGPDGAELPRLPGFREMALRRMAGERRRLVTELTEQRQAAGLSQTQVAARMGTSQSAVARLEAGEADVRASTLERYAAAIGSQISWRLQDPGAAEPPQPGPLPLPGSLQRGPLQRGPVTSGEPGTPGTPVEPGTPVPPPGYLAPAARLWPSGRRQEDSDDHPHS